MNILGKFTFFLLLVLFATGCHGPDNSDNIYSDATWTVKPNPSSTTSRSDFPKSTTASSEVKKQVVFGFTHQNNDGNRNIRGSGGFPFLQPIDIPLPGKPIWILANPLIDGIVWTAALEDGGVISYHMLENGAIAGEPERLESPVGQPPAATSEGDFFSLVLVEDAEQSQSSHPVYLPLSDQRAYITRDGEINIIDEFEQLNASLDVHTLPDARILSDESGRLLVLSGPTDKYPHGVLGDQIEASGFTLIETLPEPRIIQQIYLPDNEVIEGLAPIWIDFVGDKQREIIVTISDLDFGSRIVVFNEDGERIAQGPTMGTPFRWRHQIAASNFGPGEGIELAVVRTPHIAGSVEFYQLQDGVLSITAEFSGITSHTLGSRNLDLSAAGDFDGDGFGELLVLSPDLSEYIAVRRTASGAEGAWRLPLDGIASSNLAGAPLPSGNMAIAVGQSNHTIRLWLPQQ